MVHRNLALYVGDPASPSTSHLFFSLLLAILELQSLQTQIGSY